MKIIDSLNKFYFQHGIRFLYLDFKYINKIKDNYHLRSYFAFWLIRVFKDNKDYEDYKTICSKLIKSIQLNDIGAFIQNVIKYNDEIYKSISDKFFIILNNIDENIYKIINNTKNNMEMNYNFNIIAICNFDKQCNVKLFFQLYQYKKQNFYIIRNSQNPNEIKLNKNKINKLFLEENGKKSDLFYLSL